MEKPITITVESGDRITGKNASKKMRSEKLVPAVAYGPKVDENLHIAIPELQLEKALASNKKVLVKLVHKGQEYQSLIQAVEFHPVTDRPTHVDLFVMEENTPVIITIPIRLTGNSPGVVEGGRLYQPLRTIQVQCLPKDIPAEIILDISKLKIGDTIDVDAIDLEGITPLRAAYGTIAVIRPPKGGLAEILGLDEEEEEGEESAEAAEGEEAPAESEG